MKCRFFSLSLSWVGNKFFDAARDKSGSRGITLSDEDDRDFVKHDGDRALNALLLRGTQKGDVGLDVTSASCVPPLDMFKVNGSRFLFFCLFFSVHKINVGQRLLMLQMARLQSQSCVLSQDL